MKRIPLLLKVILCILGAAVVAAALFVGYLTVREYRPEAREVLTPLQPGAREAPLPGPGDTVRVLTMNIGYAGLSAGEVFFMDGGKTVRPGSKDLIEQNIGGIRSFLDSAPWDCVFIQEADRASRRSWDVDEAEFLSRDFGGSAYFAYNFLCPYVPFPLWEHMGKVASGLLTLNRLPVSGAERIRLTSPFKWPVRVANLKRCLLVERVPLKNGKSLVLANLHLEAYSSDERREDQRKELLGFLENEYAQGNYCIAGGDFNQGFPNSMQAYPLKSPDLWRPGELDQGTLPPGWKYAGDVSAPSCRLLDAPYDPLVTQHYVIDGFVLSPNVELLSVKTENLGFKNTDHNPVALSARLK